MTAAVLQWADTLCLCMFAFGRNGVFNRLLDGKIERMS
jgi:hypothetical protein